MPVTDNSKEMCIPPPADPGECATGDAPISGEGLNGGKTEAAPAVPVATPIAEGSCFALLQKKKIISVYHFYATVSSLRSLD